MAVEITAKDVAETKKLLARFEQHLKNVLSFQTSSMKLLSGKIAEIELIIQFQRKQYDDKRKQLEAQWKAVEADYRATIKRLEKEVEPPFKEVDAAAKKLKQSVGEATAHVAAFEQVKKDIDLRIAGKRKASEEAADDRRAESLDKLLKVDTAKCNDAFEDCFKANQRVMDLVNGCKPE